MSVDTSRESRTGLVWIAGLVAAKVVFHALTGDGYGFHRDELATLDDARRLAWGYVAYPPLTPAIGSLGLEWFGATPAGVRVFAALAQGLSIFLAALMARDLGGNRKAQAGAAMAVAVGGVSLGASALFQYVAFDFLWWVLAAWCTLRLLRSDDPRWWIGIGAALGLGLQTKYTILFLAVGIAFGVLVTPARRYLRSPWLWIGAAVALLIFLPNLLWQVQHQFVSLDFLRSIHARDVRIGRTSGFLLEQLTVPANPFTIPLWIAGLVWLFRAGAARRYRVLGWMFVVPLLLFTVAKGRSYYMAPAYTILLAAGAVAAEGWLGTLRTGYARWLRGTAWAGLAAGGILAALIVLPLAPVHSAVWNRFTGRNDDMVEEIGWPELVAEVARIRDTLTPKDRARLGILAGNYGEAGAINLYGPALGLPRAISGVNSYWAQGYGDPPPDVLIVVGINRLFLEKHFAACTLAGHVTNRYGVRNEETRQHPDIFVCRGLREPWPDFWKKFRYFG